MLSTFRVLLWAAACACLVASLAVGQDIRTGITGECVYDEATDKTTCTYVVAGTPSLSHIIIPFAENCAEEYEVRSYFYRFEDPLAWDEPFCAEIYGIMCDRLMQTHQVEMFYITYLGDQMHNVDMVNAALKTDNECEMHLVPGIVDCAPEPCIDISLNGTGASFFVKKPGHYGARAITMSVTTNVPVTIAFQSFDHLISETRPEVDPILASYATAAVADVLPAEFLPPGVFNEHTIYVPAENESGQCDFALWTSVATTRETPGCEYHDEAVIQVILENSTIAEDEDY
jgi:hypothetical protein